VQGLDLGEPGAVAVDGGVDEAGSGVGPADHGRDPKPELLEALGSPIVFGERWGDVVVEAPVLVPQGGYMEVAPADWAPWV